MRTICRNIDCGKSFIPERAGAQYCSGRCRTAAHRKRLAPLPETFWQDGKRRRVEDELAEQLIKIADEGDDGEAKTGRRYYYLALSYGYLVVDMSDTAEGRASRAAAYARVTKKLGALRMAGKLSWDMVLDLTRELDEWQVYSSPREARADMRHSYDEDRWLGQKHFPVMVIEKDTLEPVCRRIAQARQMPFASSRGYSSLKLQYDVAQMLRHRFARTGQTARVYFISDLDPSGLDLQRAWEDALGHFGAPVKVIRIGLTAAQVADPALGLDRLSIEVKPSDSRAKAYIEQYGDRCWEADVLPANVIEAALRRELGQWFDAKRWDRTAAEIEQARKLL